VGVRQPVEGGSRLRVPGEGLAERRRHLDLSFGQVQRDVDLDRVPCLDTRASASFLVSLWGGAGAQPYTIRR
jgi:hypothetical protein